MAEELLSIEMRLTVDRALRDYNEFKDKLKARPIEVKFDLGLNKVLADAQAHFKQHKISMDLDWSDARSSFVKLTKEFGSIKTKIHVDDTELVKLKRDIVEVDRSLIDIGVAVNRTGFDAFEKQVKGLADRSIKLSALADTKGFEAFQKSLAALRDRTISISGGSGLGALQKDVQSLVADLQGLSDRVVNLSVNRSGSGDLATLVAELEALRDKTINLKVDTTGEDSLARVTKDIQEMQGKTVDLRVDVKGDEISALTETIAELKSKSTLSLAVDVQGEGIRSLTESLEALKSKSALSLAVDVKGEGLKSLTESLETIRAQSTLSLAVDVKGDSIKSLTESLEALKSKSALSLAVDVKGEGLKSLTESLETIRAQSTLSLAVDVQGEGIRSLTESMASLRSQSALSLKVDVVGDDIQNLLSTIDDIRAKALKLDVQVGGGEFKDLVGTLDKLSTEVLQLRVTADNSDPTLRIVHEQIEDFKAAAHNGINVPITADATTFGTTTALLKSLESLAIQVEVDKGKLAAAVALIQSNLNPEDFVAKLTIDTGDLEGSMKRLREAQRELTDVKKGMEGAFAIQATQDVLTQQIRNVKELQAANEDRIRREAALQRFEGTKTMKEFQAWAKELSITPTTGLKKADYEAMFKSLLEIEDAAELVAKAWKITGQKFDSVTDEMEAKSAHTKNVLWGNLNHGAADLVRFAWDRTSDSFKGDLTDMEQASERAGKQIAEALSDAAKDSKFKLTVDSKQAKKDLGAFQNYARLLAKNDLDFNINTLKANTNYDELKDQLTSLHRLKRAAAKEDKVNIQVEIDGINDQIAAYKQLEKAAKDEYRARIDALDTQSKAYKVLIANIEAEEKAQNDVTKALKQTREEADRLADERAAAVKQRQADDDKAIAAQEEYLQGQQRIADEAAKNRALDARERAEFDKKRAAAQDAYLADLREQEEAKQKIIDDANKKLQRQTIKDLMTIKDTKVDPSVTGGLGIAGIGAGLSAVQKLQEKLDAVQRTIRDLRSEQVKLEIDDNLPEFRAALNKLAKEEITINAKIRAELDGDTLSNKLKGWFASNGREIAQGFGLDLQNVIQTAIQGAVQGYQAIFNGLAGLAKSSLTEFGAIQASAQQTATLLDVSGRNPFASKFDTSSAEGQLKSMKALYDALDETISRTSISSGNLFGGKDIGKAASELARAGASLSFIQANMTRIATAATAAGEEINKVGNTSLAFQSKYSDATDGAVEKYNKQTAAVKLTAFALTNAKISADNFLKTVQYTNPINRTSAAMKDLVADTAAYAKVGVIGSKVGTGLNTLFKDLTKSLDGNSKKAIANRDAFAEIEAAIGKIDYDKFKDDDGNIKDTSESLQELVRIYAEYENKLGSSKATAQFQEIFGTQGMNALKNGVAVLGEERARIRAQLDKTVTDYKDVSEQISAIIAGTSDAFTTRFAESMKQGWEGGLRRFENIRDSYYKAIGKALAPVAGGVLTVMNEVLERSFNIGGSGLAEQIDRIKTTFEAFGKNDTIINNLALAFNRVSTAVGGKLLGLIERLFNYLSDESKVMELANGISFWITSTIDAFATATEFIVGIGVAAAQAGNTLSGVTFAPLSAESSKSLSAALGSVDKIKTAMADLEGLAEAYAADIDKIKAQLGDEVALSKMTVEEREKLQAKLTDYESKVKQINDAHTAQNSKLKEQEAIVARINAEANKPIEKANSMSTAMTLLGGAMRFWNELKINDDLKYIWDSLLAPATAGLIQVLAVAVGALGLAVKGVATIIAAPGALADPESWKNLGYAIKATRDDIQPFAEKIGLADDRMKALAITSPVTALALGTIGKVAKDNGISFESMGKAAGDAAKWVQDKAAETTKWLADEEAKRTARNAEEGAKREAYWNQQGDNIKRSISGVTTWFSDRWREAGDQWNTWMSSLGTSWNTAMTNIGNSWNMFITSIGPAFERAKAAVVARLQAIAQHIGNMASRIPAVFQAAWAAASSGASRIGDILYSSFARALNGVQSAIGQVVDYFQSSWQQAIDGIGGRISGLIDQARRIPVVGGLIPGHARGGVIYGPPSKTDNVIIAARGGEGVLVPEAVAAMGGAMGLERFNRRAEAGIAGFAAGGVVSPLAQLTVPGGKTTAEYIKSRQVIVEARSVNPPAVNTAIVATAKTAEKSAALAKTTALDQASYWARSLALLNNLYAGLKSISDKISQIKVSFAQPIAAYGSGKGLLATPMTSIPLPTTEVGPRLVGYTGATGIGTAAHLHIQIKDKSRALTKAELGRFVVGGKNLANETSTSGYGPRSAPVAGASTFHGGIDYGFADGTPIVTSSPIKSRKVWEDPNGGGIVTDILFEDGLEVRILHSNPKTKDLGAMGKFIGTPSRSVAANSIVSRGTGGLSQKTVNQWLEGGTNSLMAKAIGMAEGNRTASGGYTKYAKGHIDPGNGAYNIGSFSAQGVLNDGTIAGSDQRVIDRLIRPRVGELFAAAAKAGVIVTPQVLFNYLDLANQAPLAATGDRNGPGFLGQLGKLKGRENDQEAIANLRVESYRLNSGRLDTTFRSQAALLKDQQRRMGELTAAISAFQIKGDVVTGAATTQQNITQAQVNFKALTEKLAPADQALIASVDAGDTAKAAADLKARLDELSAQRDALVKSAPTPKDPKKATPAEVQANKALQDKIKALDKRKSDLQSVINATYKIDNAETQVQNRKDESAYSDAIAALNEQARNISGEKETVKESAKLRDLLRQREEYKREVDFATSKKDADLRQLDLEFKGQLDRERKRKDGNVPALQERQAGERAQRVRALDEAIKEAQFSLEGQLTKISDFYKLNALDDRADKLAEITALQKRIREKTINESELKAAMQRLGIAQINGQFVVDKALSASLSDISGKVDKAADRSQGQIEKLLRGQGLVLKDALFEALDLEYNYYMQKRDTDLNKATSEQLSFLYGKNMLRTGSFEGGSYVQGAQGNIRDRLGEIALTSEAAIRNKKLDAINALYRAGGIDEAMAQKMAMQAGGSVEVVRAGVNPGLKQATGKRLTTLSDVPYTSPVDIQTAIRESQSSVAAPLVAASAPSASSYMAKATSPMRIKLDIPPGTDERITSVVRQTESALNSTEFSQRMLGELMSILRSDPQMARQVFY